MEQKFNATLTLSGSMRRTIQYRIRASMKFVNIHIVRTTFLRLILGPDQLTRRSEISTLTLRAFKAQPIVPDQFIRFEPAIDILWLAPNTFEEELSGPPYGRLLSRSGLTEPELPPSVKSTLPEDKSRLIKMRNQTALISYDLATNTREVSESYS